LRIKLNDNVIKALEDFYCGLGNVFYCIESRNGSFDSFISENVEKITGFTAAEIQNLPESHYSLIFIDDQDLIKKKLAEFESDKKLHTLELTYRISKKNGEIIWLREFLTIDRDPTDQSINSIKRIVLNINEIKNSEMELKKKNDALKELNLSKDKFISIISHDIRSPFTTLLGFSEILLNEPELTEDEKNEYLKYIYDASKSQLDMINCLLDWSRLQTGRIKIEPARLNVKSIISTSITPLTGDAVRKNIDVRIDIPVDLHINADERLIGQVIYHLTSNAIKYTPEGKEIHITSGRFKEGMIEIIVRDEGLGIAEEHHTKLFRIDEKFSLVGTSGEKGSGLGLTLVKEIIDKHNGQIWFYSHIGEGSEFHFTVPEAKNVILVVESNQEIRASFQNSIEKGLPNFEVKFSDNGYQAISHYREFLPTVIITDHDMPLMNGIQLIEAIQKKESNRTIPIIVLAAQITDELTRKYKRLSVDMIFQKPVDYNFLVQSIRESIY
jgi:PAS domain S-box-containing protein